MTYPQSVRSTLYTSIDPSLHDFVLSFLSLLGSSQRSCYDDGINDDAEVELGVVVMGFDGLEGIFLRLVLSRLVRRYVRHFRHRTMDRHHPSDKFDSVQYSATGLSQTMTTVAPVCRHKQHCGSTESQ